MERNPGKELQRLKKEYFEMEKTHAEEKACLCEVIHTLGSMVGGQEETSPHVGAIRKIIRAKGPVKVELLQKEVQALKGTLLSRDRELESQRVEARISALRQRILEVCRLLRKIVVALTEDFYPLGNLLEKRTDDLDLNCKEEVLRIPFEATTSRLLSFVHELKVKIEEDFRYVNKNFLILLEHVKGLEKSLRKEFGGEERMKEIEYFEMRINHEVGSIVNSFDIYTTIHEVKTVVVQKIKNIKKMISERKKEDTERIRSARRYIANLQERIAGAEQNAREMSRKAEQLEMVAMRDGLTGLYNRKALEIKVRNALRSFQANKEPFAMILLDVDRFKEVNDTFGHVAGDKVLQKVSQCLKETFRENDFVGRYGGDEFVVVIEKLTEEMAMDKVRRFRENLAKRRFISHRKGKVDVTVSAGIAVALEGDTAEKIIERADRTMYAKKHEVQ